MIDRLCRSPTIRPRAREDGEMGRHGVLRRLDQARQFARRDAVGLARHQKAEHVEPRRLRQRRQGGYGFDVIHISRLTDMM